MASVIKCEGIEVAMVEKSKLRICLEVQGVPNRKYKIALDKNGVKFGIDFT